MVLLGVFIAVPGRGSMVKGLIAGSQDIVLSSVGYYITYTIPHFTFRVTELFNGIGVVPMALGILTVPEVINFMLRGGTIAKGGETVKAPRADLVRANTTAFNTVPYSKQSSQ
ncbi:tripartite tricarboxylate transporter permease [Chloroflexota bacterium]